MKNIFKRISACVIAFVMVVGASFALTGCGKKAETKVMNLSVNPSIEFIVDEDDKVISVSATNEDGAYILQKYTEFTGMSAKDAALKFLELSEEYGFVVEGSTDGETFTISVSGENAEELYNTVKNKISSKATELGVSIQNLVKVGKEELKSVVAECYKEYSSADLENLTEKELVKLIQDSREETKNLFTEDEKQAYYRERAQKVISAKIDAINNYLEENNSIQNLIITPIVNAMNTIYSTLESTFNSINAQIEEMYTNASTGVNAKLDDYIELKKEYLAAVEEYKQAVENSSANVETLKQEMEALKAQAEQDWAALKTARDNVKQQFTTLMETTVQEILTNLNTQVNSLLEKIDLTAQEISQEVQSQITALKTEYENSTSNPWA